MHGTKIKYVVLSAAALFCSLLLSCTDKNMAVSNGMEVKPDTIPALKLTRVFKQIALDSIVFMTQAPGNDQYWYVVEKAGRVLRIDSESESAKSSVFIDISERVDSSPNEAGLLGMAFHPEYKSNGYVYLSYTGDNGNLISYVSRFSLSNDGNSLDPDSEKRLIELEQPYSNHNGGNILFGPDGYLYIGFGDGGSGGDPKGHGQNTKTLLGAMLRLDVDHGDPYAIPPGNPFAVNNQGRPEIYLWGLRNPWRFSFDRGTAMLWVADVGQNSWEEVNVVNQAGNLGWNGKEGTHCYKSATCRNPAYIDPVIEYDHDQGCSITGGYVYRGTAIPKLRGTYLYSDFCSGTLWGAREESNGTYISFKLLDTGLNIASFAQSNSGDVYILHLSGEVYKIVTN